MILSWNTTNQCNMFCSHCYREAGEKAQGELTTAEGKKLIEEIKKAGFRIMIFSGGEPLMRPDIFELIAYATKVGLRTVLGTNGTLITAEVAAKLKAAGVMGVGISLDSLDQQKHDTLRAYEGAWQQAVAGMANCRNAGLPFQIHTTIMDWMRKKLKPSQILRWSREQWPIIFSFWCPQAAVKKSKPNLWIERLMKPFYSEL